MNQAARDARNLVQNLRRQLNSAESLLCSIEQRCPHVFGEPVSDPIIHKAYTIPGDPPGTMGIDWRGDHYVPERRIPRWLRTCNLCGKVEETTVCEETVVKGPRFT